MSCLGVNAKEEIICQKGQAELWPQRMIEIKVLTPQTCVK